MSELAKMADRVHVLRALRSFTAADDAAEEARLLLATVAYLQHANGWTPDSELVLAVLRRIHAGQHEAAALKLRPRLCVLQVLVGDAGPRVDGWRVAVPGGRPGHVVSEECATVALSVAAACVGLWTQRKAP